MHTAANISRVLTDSSSLKRFADFSAISYAGFYQQYASGLPKGVNTTKNFDVFWDRLVALAEHVHVFREMETLEQISLALTSAPLPARYRLVGEYYQALCIQRSGYGDVQRAERLLERIADVAPPKYRVRALISLAASSRNKNDNQSALSLYWEAARFASCSRIQDPYATLGTQRMFAVINSEDGNHRDALALLENLIPLANAMRSASPHVYYDFMNSLAVELTEAGRLEEAKSVSRIVLASPFAGAYPEWRATYNEIELKGLRASRSVLAFSKTIVDEAPGVNDPAGAEDAPLTQPTAGLLASPARVEGGNVVRLPLTNRSESSVEASPAGQPARVLSLQEWKEKMAKLSSSDPPGLARRRPATSKEDRIKEMERLGTRGMLLRAMEMLGDEDVNDDRLRRALLILEGLDPEANPGA